MNNPFYYTPSPECGKAAKELADWISGRPSPFCSHPVPADFRAEVDKGKMFGVLVVEGGSRKSQTYLAAYSGQVCGRSDWPEFVPAVFDYLQPDGYFKRHEAEITAINALIRNSLPLPSSAVTDNGKHTKDERPAIHKGKLEGESDEHYIRRRQFENAELHRWKLRERKRLAGAEEESQQRGEKVEALKALRRQKSDGLQRWLFRHFIMMNGRGETADLLEIWPRHNPIRNQHPPLGGLEGLLPPAGAGECCEPKLLQYAFVHGMKPVSMAMFWWGESPRQEVRRHLQFYPACNSKCKPILKWMLQGIDVAPNPLESKEKDAELAAKLKTIYEDGDICVVVKPAGLLAVPGKSGRESVLGIMRRRYPDTTSPLVAHRLDMDTSGLMVVAKTVKAYHDLQRQFAAHVIRKRYVAVLSNSVPKSLCGRSGVISLPLRPDIDDRPRQLVDFAHGRTAVTRYEIVGERRVLLWPQTGRTHQLRVHCAHRQGLDNPIVGDPLYGCRGDMRLGQSSGRMLLHAETISFRHPVSGKTMTFTSKAPF